MGGRKANAAYWFYGKDKGEWVSSKYYMEELPEWVDNLLIILVLFLLTLENGILFMILIHTMRVGQMIINLKNHLRVIPQLHFLMI